MYNNKCRLKLPVSILQSLFTTLTRIDKNKNANKKDIEQLLLDLKVVNILF